jgi:hypothetical protein
VFFTFVATVFFVIGLATPAMVHVVRFRAQPAQQRC